MDDQYSNPWKTIHHRMVYENPWIHVREDAVIRPDGEPGIYGVIHMKSKAIGIIPIDERENIYLVGQYRYTIDQYSWEIPKGGCLGGEEFLVAAKRELLEETGLEARSWRLLGRTHLSNSVTDDEAYYYLATDLVQHEARPEGTEKLQCQRIPFEEALRMVLAGEITDSLTMIAILHYSLLRARKM